MDNRTSLQTLMDRLAEVDPNAWLREVGKLAPAVREAELLRTALVHQSEFRRSGKHTSFGDGNG